MPINPVVPGISTAPISAPALEKSSGAGFAAVLQQAVQQVEEAKTQADQRMERFLSGEGEEVHQVMLAVQEAELRLELFQQVRNKVVQAYQEIMRMQL
jgi:flagellar hook-basal body complex protein FliE